MSIQSEITRISGNVADALDAIENKGVTIPAGSNSDDLADLIGQITGGGSSGIVISDTADPAGGTVRTITAVEISGTKSITTNGTGINVAEYAAVNVSVPTGTPRSSSDLTASGDTVTVPAGLYSSNATKAVASGTAGTPSATKGTVSNHSVTVTPSVTNTAGYISGGTKTGTAVTVSAAELASGDKEITSNGSNIDVVGYSTVSVNVSGGGTSKNTQVAAGINRVNTTSYTAVSGQTLTVAKTGTYDVYWSGYRSSTSGTNGSQLYINNTAHGSAQTTFFTNGQAVHLSGVSLTQGQTIEVRARARTTSYYMYVANLTIVEA